MRTGGGELIDEDDVARIPSCGCRETCEYCAQFELVKPRGLTPTAPAQAFCDGCGKELGDARVVLERYAPGDAAQLSFHDSCATAGVQRHLVALLPATNVPDVSDT